MAALLISDQATLLYAELKPLFQPLFALIGYLVLVLISGLIGPTGIAMNPVRDTVPRFVHWLLPQPRQGLIRVVVQHRFCTAGLAGGLAGAGLYKALSMLNHMRCHSQKREGFYSTIQNLPRSKGAAARSCQPLLSCCEGLCSASKLRYVLAGIDHRVHTLEAILCPSSIRS